MTTAEIFEGTGVKRYVLRHRQYEWDPWVYPGELEFDALEEAQAALEAMTVSRGYQIAEKLPCLRYGPVGSGLRSKLLKNLLTAFGNKPYVLRRFTRYGWMQCNDLQFDTLEEAQEAAQSGAGSYQVLEAGLYMRYEPVDGGAAAWTMKS